MLCIVLHLFQLSPRDFICVIDNQNWYFPIRERVSYFPQARHRSWRVRQDPSIISIFQMALPKKERALTILFVAKVTAKTRDEGPGQTLPAYSNPILGLSLTLMPRGLRAISRSGVFRRERSGFRSFGKL